MASLFTRPFSKIVSNETVTETVFEEQDSPKTGVDNAKQPASAEKIMNECMMSLRRVRKPYLGRYFNDLVLFKVPDERQIQHILSIRDSAQAASSDASLLSAGIRDRTITGVPSLNGDDPRTPKSILHHRIWHFRQSLQKLDIQRLRRGTANQQHIMDRSRKAFLCYQCTRVLPATRFAKGQLSGECLPGHSHPYKRFCIACGIQQGLYKFGNRITIQDYPFHLCRSCKIPAFGRFCTQCHTCGSCLGLTEYTVHVRAKCPHCGIKKLRVHPEARYLTQLQEIEQLIFQARALINLLYFCGCETCIGWIDQTWKMQPKPTDLVRQGLQLEMYHFSYIGRLRVVSNQFTWPPAIVRKDHNGTAVRVGFEDPQANVHPETYLQATGICYSQAFRSVADMSECLVETCKSKRAVNQDPLAELNRWLTLYRSSAPS